MANYKNLIGSKFERLTVLSEFGVKNRKRYWNCACECGNKSVVRGSELNYGSVKSCGCLQKDSVTTHGNTNKRLFRIWKQMIKRCTNPKHNRYHLYGAKGIKVCDIWLNNFSAFENWSLVNGYKDNLSIVRINTEGDYKPSNCRWSTAAEQNRNYSRNIKYKGECAIDAAKRLGGNVHLVTKRVALGWTLEKAFTTPLKK